MDRQFLSVTVVISKGLHEMPYVNYMCHLIIQSWTIIKTIFTNTRESLTEIQLKHIGRRQQTTIMHCLLQLSFYET